MKKILALTFLLSAMCAVAQPKVVAHRGYWKTDGSAQNSITALKKANQIKAWGSEFDVSQTADGVLVVNHDATIGPDKILIEGAKYDDIKDITLANGEKVPTLEQYLKAAKKCKNVRLVLEVKPHTTSEKNIKATRDAMAMVKKMGLAKKTEYISFASVVCDEVLKVDPKAKVAFLGSSMSAQAVKDRGYTGVDFLYTMFINNPNLVKQCHDLGLTVNVWTVDKDDLIRKMIEQGVDYITTNVPERTEELIKEAYTK
ncbi:MAG: glycerophosphodiester phosphodiesterase family protein [Flavobacteriales bacterium]|nr:glycerophosphodiester phosphodiesterase family protein [Flavobacteriales bacterium]